MQHTEETQVVSPDPVVEGSVAASDIVSTEPPDEPHISEFPTMPLVPPKRYFRLNWWSIIALALLFLLAGEHGLPLVLSLVNTYLHPTATVTLFPTQKEMSQTYSFLAVTGTADPVQKQVSSRLLTFTTPTQTETIKTTGIGYTQPVQAQGTITFYNEAPYSQTIDAGTVITGSDGIQIVTDETVTIAAGSGATNGSATVPAHTIQAGQAANIAPLAINGLCCVAGILAKNTTSFSGGEDRVAYPIVSQADLDAAAKQLAGTLDPQAKDAISSQVKITEQLLTPLNCTYQTTATPKVGEKATTAPVSVSETCNVQVYDDKAFLYFRFEDNPMLQLLLAGALQERGYTVIVTSDGLAALQNFEQHAASIALVIADIKTPKMTGIQLYEHIRRGGSTTRFLFVSGYQEREVSQHVVLDKSSAFLEKPFRLGELVTTVRELLG